MSTELTPLLSRFVTSMNAFDSAIFTDCFAENAVMEDEGHTHHGSEAIRSWIENAFVQYAPKLDVIEVNSTHTGHIITGQVSGTFPGSPITLHYHLTHDDTQIHSLRCTV